MLRPVTTPSNGATMFANAFCAFNRSRLGLGRVDLGGAGAGVGGLLVGSLLRHRRGPAQRIPARRSNLRERKVRFGFGELALRNRDALIELWRVDDREHVALLDLGANILSPFLARNH